MPGPSPSDLSETTDRAGTVLVPVLARVPGHLIWRAAARVTQALSDVLPAGVDLHAYAALLALADDAARSQQDLSRRIAVSRTTMVRVAADLARSGLVERVRNADDRRSYALTRTPGGAAAAASWQLHADHLEADLTRGFTGAETAELTHLLHLIAAGDLAADTPQALLGSIDFLVTRVHFGMHRAFMAALEPLGIEPRHYGALTALRASGPVPQSELARMLGISGASIVQIVDDLEHRGLVERRRAEADRRAHLLHVLPEAAPVLKKAAVVAARVHETQLAPLTPTQTERLVDLLGRFVEEA